MKDKKKSILEKFYRIWIQKRIFFIINYTLIMLLISTMFITIPNIENIAIIILFNNIALFVILEKIASKKNWRYWSG